jgi:hypothetical protein
MNFFSFNFRACAVKHVVNLKNSFTGAACVNMQIRGCRVAPRFKQFSLCLPKKTDQIAIRCFRSETRKGLFFRKRVKRLSGLKNANVIGSSSYDLSDVENLEGQIKVIISGKRHSFDSF